jgi:hypothetical protein
LVLHPKLCILAALICFPATTEISQVTKETENDLKRFVGKLQVEELGPESTVWKARGLALGEGNMMSLMQHFLISAKVVHHGTIMCLCGLSDIESYGNMVFGCLSLDISSSQYH